jgi:hypothetical protein
MFGSGLKAKISDLEYELKQTDIDLANEETKNTQLTNELRSLVQQTTEMNRQLAGYENEIRNLKERLATEGRVKADLQKSLNAANVRNDSMKRNQQEALDDWSRLTVWLLDHAPEDIIQGSKGTTVDMAIALLTRWMPVEAVKIVDADIIDEDVVVGLAKVKRDVDKSLKIKPEYVNPEDKRK